MCKTSAGFLWENHLKLNWTKKKVYQNIELTFNFTKEIHVKKTKIAFNFQKKSHEKNRLKFYIVNPLEIFQKITSWRPFLKKVTVVVWFWKFLKISPTSPKFNTHKIFVLHFFISMLLLPKTPTLIYLKLKKIKGPKTHSLFTSHHKDHFWEKSP